MSHELSHELYNKIMSANTPILGSFKNRYKGEPIVFQPLVIRFLLAKCEEDNEKFAKLMELLLDFPLSKESQDEVRTANFIGSILNNQVVLAKSLLAEPDWSIRLLPGEIRLVARFCREEGIRPCSPVFGRHTAEIASLVNKHQ